MRGIINQALLAILGIILSGSASGLSPLRPLTLEEQLRQGGLVIYLNHGVSEGPSENPEVLGPCSTQERLSSKGRKQAAELRAYLQSERVAFAEAISSPACPAMETTAIVAGPMRLDHDLLPMHGDLPEKEKAERLLAVKKLLAAPPSFGTNTLLVSHGNKEVLGIDLEEGEFAVVAPLGDGAYRYLGKRNFSFPPAATEEPPPAWIVAEVRLAAGLNYTKFVSDSALWLMLDDGSLVWLHPHTLQVARIGNICCPRGRLAGLALEGEVEFAGHRFTITYKGEISVDGTGLPLPGGPSAIVGDFVAADRLWLSRPDRKALLIIDRK